jgi:hypothetical protein
MKPLYKFVASRGAALAIANGSLKFTRIEELNDPSELVPLMNRDAVLTSLNTLRKEGYTQEQFEWLSCQESILRLLSPETRVLSRPATIAAANRTLALPVYDNLDFMERQLLATISLMRSRVGILSLTERCDSLPMWAHYAANARGYVVCFRELDREYTGDTTSSLNALKPVRYVQDLLGLTHDPSTQDNLFFCKFQDWSYEREWRIVSALSSCQLSADRTLHLRRIDPSIVMGIICGWNVTPEEVELLASEVGRKHRGIKVQIASLDRGRVSLRDHA